jgi:serine protease
VAAAGNDGNNRKSYPASYDSVISVAAIDSNKAVAAFSQKNNAVELAAPGVAVLSTLPYLETNTVTALGTTYSGNWVEHAARTTGLTGVISDGGLCTASSAAWQGRIVLCERGTNSFYEKVHNSQLAGAIGTVIFNNVDGGLNATLGDGNSSTIPAVGLTRTDGLALRSAAVGQNATLVSKVQAPYSSYAAWDGTSMATPHVSGVAALIWSANVTWTNVQIRKALQASAEDLGAAGRDSSYGFGLVQAKAALDYLRANF